MPHPSSCSRGPGALSTPVPTLGHPHPTGHPCLPLPSTRPTPLGTVPQPVPLFELTQAGQPQPPHGPVPRHHSPLTRQRTLSVATRRVSQTEQSFFEGVGCRAVETTPGRVLSSPTLPSSSLLHLPCPGDLSGLGVPPLYTPFSLGLSTSSFLLPTWAPRHCAPMAPRWLEGSSGGQGPSGLHSCLCWAPLPPWGSSISRADPPRGPQCPDCRSSGVDTWGIVMREAAAGTASQSVLGGFGGQRQRGPGRGLPWRH